MVISGKFLISFLVIAITYQMAECGFAPPLPTGRRTQYYYIYEDGAYKYGYDTGEGSYGKAVASPENEVQGDYAYQGPDGKIDVKYTAGKAGFIPDGYTPPQTGPSTYHGHANSDSAGHLSGQYNPAEDELPGDASYTFSYNVGDQSRKEVSDSTGNIQGSYTFISKDGSTKKVDYEAGAEKGFVIKGISPSSGKAGSGYSGQEAGFSNPDGSYSFSYVAGDHSRHESADANGNIVGSFSFIAKDDNVNREVNYNAGAERGFTASGSHLPEPVQPITSVGPGSVSGQHGVEIARIHSGHAGLGAVSTYSAPQHHAPATTYSAAAHTHSASHSETGTADPGRAYEFSYDAGDHSRHESSDANGNVVGSFSFIAKDDGLNRKLDYEAGAEKGFVAFGSHLPSAPSVRTSGQTYHSAKTVQSHIQSPTVQHPHTHTAVAQPHLQSPTAHHSQSDGSYSFSYDAGDHSRTESVDANGNVIGSFSFVAKDDGLNRHVDYEAGKEIGFIARGDHLPKEPASTPHGVATLYNAPSVSAATTGSSHSGTYSGSAFKAHHSSASPSAATHASAVNPQGDGSYSFSFDAGDHTRHESSDTAGNVVGSYTFVAKDDGVQRKVSYEAGAKRGFTASGEHLPLQPSAVAPLIASGKHGHDYDSEDYNSYNPKHDYDAHNNDYYDENSDRSYSFSYNAGDHTRTETADSLGNVIGTFSFVAKDDGVNRKLDYEAGAEKGFLAKGSHLPVPPPIDNAFSHTATHHTGAHHAGTYHAATSHAATHHAATHHAATPHAATHHAAPHHTATHHAPGAGAGTYAGVGHSEHGGAAHAGIAAPGEPTYLDNKAFFRSFLTPNSHHKFGYIYDTSK